MSKRSSNVAGFYLVPVDSYKSLAELKQKNEQLEKQLSEALKYKSLATSEKVAHLQNLVKKLEAELESHKKIRGENVGNVSSQRFEPSDAEQQQQQQQQGGSSDIASLSSQGGSSNLIVQEQQQKGGSSSSGDIADGSDVADDNVFRQKLFSSFQTFLKTHKLIQCGSGTFDLTPRIPVPMVELPEVKPSPENVTDLDVMNTDQKLSDDNDLNRDDIDENRLLGSVRIRSKDKARELLSNLKEHSDYISFQSNGDIVINGEPLPNGNIYKLFPLLFRPLKNHRDNASLAALLDAIASLGLGHLLLRNYTVGITPKGKNYLKGRGELLQHLKNKQPWFYLGGHDQ